MEDNKSSEEIYPKSERRKNEGSFIYAKEYNKCLNALESAEARIQELEVELYLKTQFDEATLKEINKLREEIKRKDQLIKKAFFNDGHGGFLFPEKYYRWEEFCKINNIEL